MKYSGQGLAHSKCNVSVCSLDRSAGPGWPWASCVLSEELAPTPEEGAGVEWPERK